MGLGSAIGWLFNSISELKHNQDIINVEVQQNASELNDIWNKYNDEQRQKMGEIAKFYEFQLEYKNDQIEYYKNK